MFTKFKSSESGKGIAPGLKVISEAVKKNAPSYKNADLLKGMKKKKLHLK